MEIYENSFIHFIYPNDTSEVDPIKNRGVQAIFMIFYTAIFVLGILGNALTCYVVFRNRAMQTVTNYFIANLALSDILLCLLCVPFTPLYTFLESWVFGKTLCHIVAPATSISVYISTVTLTSIAIDRFFVIIYPFRRRMKTSTCLAIVLGSWLFSILATLPYGYHVSYLISYQTNAYDFNDTTIAYYCEESWPGHTIRKIYGGVTVTMQFIIPFTIIAFCYTKVSLRLKQRCKPGSKNSRKEEVDRERKRRTNRMLIAMVSIFALSWLPINCINIVNDFNSQVGYWKYYNLLFFIFHALAMSSTCYNPFLYAWLNENFRKEFKQVLPGFDCVAGPTAERLPNWRAEQTCTGNETETTLCQSASMVRRSSSIKMQTQEMNKDSERQSEVVAVENAPAPKATYNLETDKVEIHMNLTSDNEVVLVSSPANGNKYLPTMEERIKIDGGSNGSNNGGIRSDAV